MPAPITITDFGFMIFSMNAGAHARAQVWIVFHDERMAAGILPCLPAGTNSILSAPGRLSVIDIPPAQLNQAHPQTVRCRQNLQACSAGFQLDPNTPCPA